MSLGRNSSGTRYYLDKVIESEKIANDGIALIRTATPIIFDDFVHPICLPSTDLCLANDSEVWMSGHGDPNEIFGWSDEDTLLYVKLFLNNTRLEESHMTETAASPSEYCQSDSGSPLQSWF